MSDDTPQFKSGYMPPTQDQKQPGLQEDLEGTKPKSKLIPDKEGNYRLYRPADKLKGYSCIITGGDSGIGRSAAILFAMEGADSLIAYLPEEETDAQETKKQVEKHGQTCHLLPLDLRERENCRKVVDTALEKMGKIDVLFNNHAYQNMVQDIQDLSEEQWLKTFDTNIHPFFYLTKYAMPHLKHGASIINNASINAYIGRPDLLDYTSTKGAIISFTRGVSNQYVAKGIRCNAIAPGPVWTPLIPSTMSHEAQDEFTSPMGRPSQPSEIAACVVFLACTDSMSVSGQTIHCNGGTVVNG